MNQKNTYRQYKYIGDACVLDLLYNAVNPKVTQRMPFPCLTQILLFNNAYMIKFAVFPTANFFSYHFIVSQMEIIPSLSQIHWCSQ